MFRNNTDLIGEHLVLVELLGGLAVLVLDHDLIRGESVVDEGIAAERERREEKWSADSGQEKKKNVQFSGESEFRA